MTTMPNTPAVNPTDNPVITAMQGAKKTAAKRNPSGKSDTIPQTAMQKVVEKQAATKALRTALRARLQPEAKSLDEAMGEIAEAVRDYGATATSLEVGKTAVLANAMSDALFYLLNEAPTDKKQLVLVPDATAARQLVNYIKTTERFKKQTIASDNIGEGDTKHIVQVSRTTLADLVPAQTMMLAAKMALLRAHPSAGVKLGYRVSMPARAEIMTAGWIETQTPKCRAMAFCVERCKIIPHLFGRDPTSESDPPAYIITGDAKSTDLRTLTFNRANALYAKHFEGKTLAVALEMKDGREPTGELFLPSATRAAHSNSSGDKVTSNTLFEQFKTLALKVRDSKRQEWPELNDNNTKAALFALVRCLVERDCKEAVSTSKSYCASAAGSELLELRNVICAYGVSDENAEGNQHALNMDGARVQIIKAASKPILPDAAAAKLRKQDGVAA